MREFANRLRSVGETLDRRATTSANTESQNVRAAASSVDRAAEQLADGNGSESELLAVLHDAADAIDASVADEVSGQL
jgi:hypothetical protein